MALAVGAGTATGWPPPAGGGIAGPAWTAAAPPAGLPATAPPVGAPDSAPPTGAPDSAPPAGACAGRAAPGIASSHSTPAASRARVLSTAPLSHKAGPPRGRGCDSLAGL